MAAVVNPRGRITVDREVRRRLGVRPGMIAVQQVVENQLIVTFIPAPHRRSLAGVLGKPPRRVPPTWEEIEEIAAGSIADEAR